MKLGWVNRLDAATLSAGSAVATLPVSLLQNVHVAKRWHTASGVKTTHVLADLGSSVAVELVALLGTNLTAAATIRIRASDSDPTAVAGDEEDTGTVSAGVDDDYRTVYHVLAAEVTARYWRIDLSDTTVADHLEVGRAFVGPAWTPSVSRLYDWWVEYADLSERTRSGGGQTYVDEGPRYRVVHFVLEWMTRAEMLDNAFEMGRRNGRHSDVLAILDPALSNLSETSVWGLLDEPVRVSQPNAKSHRAVFRIEERL